MTWMAEMVEGTQKMGPMRGVTDWVADDRKPAKCKRYVWDYPSIPTSELEWVCITLSSAGLHSVTEFRVAVWSEIPLTLSEVTTALMKYHSTKEVREEGIYLAYTSTL